VLDPELSCFFIGGVSLASNRTATAASLKLPTGVITNLMRSFLSPEDFTAFDGTTHQAAFETQYPQGDYEFTVEATSSNQIVTVNLPAGMQQPNAPRVSNFPATQAVNPTQPFTLTWDPFVGGTATDYIHVSVGDQFNTGNLGATNALTGTATSVTIPAGVLNPSTTNQLSVSFWRYAATTNSASVYTTLGYRLSTTQLELVKTTNSAGGNLKLENTATVGR